jgi:hypothetical protein
MLFKCEHHYQVTSNVRIEAGGQIQIGFSVYHPLSVIRFTSYLAYGNHWLPRPPDFVDMCRGKIELYIEGWVWFMIEFSILGYNCQIQYDFKAKYEAVNDEVSLTAGRSGGCGPVSVGVEVTLKWSPARTLFFPKAPPTGFEIKVTGALTIDGCVRVCHPWGKCGWRGCRYWDVCHTACTTVSMAATLGPFALN